MKTSALALILALTSGFVAASPRSVATASGSTDARILSTASLQRGRDGSHVVTRRLRLQPAVESASLGRDHQTVDVRFRDGMHAAILPRLQRNVALTRLRPFVRTAAPTGGPAAQAAVWEPFAAELGLGPNAGDVEVQQLQAAGFAVDQKYDTNVTVAQLALLSHFNVVYMHTHSGVSAGGDGVVASGEPANGDPAVAPFLQDGSVITVGVAGTSQLYYGITSKFISAHEGTFPAKSLLFLNGCALLRATTFWQALQARGAATLISWDQNAAAKDDFLSAAAFFNVMGGGQTVSAAISTLRASGYGASSDNGVPATLGYVGDGSITLHTAAAGGNGNPTPTPVTSTPVLTATAIRTPAPVATTMRTATLAPATTSTLTPVPTHPPVPALVSLRDLVKPGAIQHISIGNLAPTTPVQLRVTFPDGEVRQSRVDSDTAGKAQFTFIQSGSMLTRQSRTAVVEITSTTASGSATTTLHYTIGYGRVDVVAHPRTLPVGGSGAILVHTRAHQPVAVTLRPAVGKAAHMHGTTGHLGWVKLSYKIKSSWRRGQRLVVRATVRLHGKNYHATTTIRVA
jgi:hypothetical protein